MIKTKSIYTNSKLVNPIKLSNDNHISRTFVDVYQYLIENGLMDNNSYALCKTKDVDYQRIYSTSSFDHKENFDKGMIRVKVNDDEHTYYCAVSDRVYEREYKQANMLSKLPDVDVVFKFKSELKLKKSIMKIDKDFNITNIGKTSPILSTPKLQMRNLLKIADAKSMWLGHLENGYSLIAFAGDWETETVLNIIGRYYRFKRKKKKAKTCMID